MGTAEAQYRIVQEAIANVIRHGDASEIRLNIAVIDNEMTVAIADNGTGIAANAERNGSGLNIMRYRARPWRPRRDHEPDERRHNHPLQLPSRRRNAEGDRRHHDTGVDPRAVL